MCWFSPGWQARRPVDAKQWSGELHQYVVTHSDVPISLARIGDHARGMGGIQSMAVAHGPGRGKVSRPDGCSVFSC